MTSSDPFLSLWRLLTFLTDKPTATIFQVFGRDCASAHCKTGVKSNHDLKSPASMGDQSFAEKATCWQPFHIMLAKEPLRKHNHCRRSARVSELIVFDLALKLLDRRSAVKVDAFVHNTMPLVEGEHRHAGNGHELIVRRNIAKRSNHAPAHGPMQSSLFE